MTTPARKKVAHSTPADSSRAVDAFLASLVHPFTAEVEELRRLVLAADPSIAEGVKWNAPSYRTTEYFATTHLRAKTGIGVVLHLGAKARALPAGGLDVPDPERLLTWLAPDRAMVSFADAKELREKGRAFQELVRHWIRYV